MVQWKITILERKLSLVHRFMIGRRGEVSSSHMMRAKGGISLALLRC